MRYTYIFATEIMLGIPNHGSNIAMTNRAVAFNDARLDRLEKAVSSIGAKNTITFVPIEGIAMASLTIEDNEITEVTVNTDTPLYIANSNVHSIGAIKAITVNCTGIPDLLIATNDMLNPCKVDDAPNADSIIVRGSLFPHNIVNSTTTMSNGMISNGFYFFADSLGDVPGETYELPLDTQIKINVSNMYMNSSYQGGTITSVLNSGEAIWISNELAAKMFTEAQLNSMVDNGHLLSNTTTPPGYIVYPLFTNTVLPNMLILYRRFSNGSGTVQDISSIVVEYE